MKLAACLTVLALTTAPAFAQTATPPAPATAAPVAKYTVDTPIETIAADPAGKAVLDAEFPGMTAHAMYESFKQMSLTQLVPMSGGAITPEQVAKASTSLAAVK